LAAWEEQDQTDLVNDEQNLIEKLEKTWKELVKASKILMVFRFNNKEC